MASEQAESLRKAIENLINAKLRDLVRPGGVDRLVANRMTGVAAYEIRDAAKKLEKVIAEAFESTTEVAAAEGEGDYRFHN
jgi:predicted NBD/HSP70 family sugar kinase